MEQKYLLEIEGVKKVFGDNLVVDNVSLNLEPGKFITFLGPSGCGKTTLLRMIAGFYNLDAGKITLKGKRIDELAPQKRNTPMVFQEYALFPHMSVYENIAYGLKIQKLPKDEIKKKVEESVELLNLHGLTDRYPNQLSGGQQQRVAIARALVNNTDLLLLDEPLSNLDAKLRESVRVELRQIQQKLGITTIYVTHDQQEALSMSDQIIVMNKGVIQEVGDPQQIYYQPKTKFVAEFIGTTNFIEGKEIERDGKLGLEYNGAFVVGDEKSKTATTTYSLRPESLILSDTKVNGVESFPVEIKYSMFLGEKTRYFVEDALGKEWLIDEFDTGIHIKEGTKELLIYDGKAHYVI